MKFIANFKWISVAAFLLVAGTVTFYLLNPPQYDFKMGDITVINTDADLQIDRMHLVQNKRGQRNWELWADTAKVYRKEDITQLKGLRLRFYPKDGDPMNITADRGLMRNQSRSIKVFGNAVIHTAQGYTLETETLEFHPRENRVFTDDPILFKGKTFQLTGTGLKGQTDSGRFILQDDVNAMLFNSPTIPAGYAQADKKDEASPEREKGDLK